MTDDLEAILDGVWSRRRTELLGRLAVMSGYLEQAAADPDAWRELGAEAHRLTGALGSLGFDLPARAARELERQVAQSPTAPDDLASQRDLVAQVRTALASATARPR